MLKHQLKLLAKTLDYIGWRSPAEFGLFWDLDGTMPWKEFYWALQEDPTLRFVRESSLRELSLLGIELSFSLDGNLLRLRPEIGPPPYHRADSVPERLYYAMKPKNLVYAQEVGLRHASRPLMPLCAERELALRIAGRREPEPIIIEVQARRALEDGISFLVAGPDLYLADSIPASFLIIPIIKRELAERLIAKRSQKVTEKKLSPPSPGSFIVRPDHMMTAGPVGKKSTKSGKNGKGGWKKDSRTERHKRES